MTVPVRTFTMQTIKPGVQRTILMFFNEGDLTLTWHLESTTNVTAWNVTPASGALSGGEVAVVTMESETAHLQARSDAYVSTLGLVSDTLDPTEQNIRIDVHSIVTATPSASKSRVTLRNLDTLSVSGTLEFELTPVDVTGMVVLDPPDVTYQARLWSLTTSTLDPVVCTVVFYQGECKLPALAAGLFTLHVLDKDGLAVGNAAGQYNLSASQCPASYKLDETGSLCACSPGTHDTGVVCEACPSGYISSETGCTQCRFPQTSNPDNTQCSECVEDYYYKNENSENVSECVSCPDAVVCNASSRIGDWKLKEGWWRSDDNSDDVRKCRFGANACPGDGLGCKGDGALCACGYVGPLCSVCDTGRGKDYFLNWVNTGPKCVICEECGSTERHTSTIVFRRIR